MKKYVLMSIKPEYANKIKLGEKTIELRRILPKVSPGDILVIYETNPTKAVTAYCRIQSTVSMPLATFWNKYNASTGISKTDFDSYFSGKLISNGIVLENVVNLSAAVPLYKIMDTPHVPQSFCYITEGEFHRLL